MLEQWKYCVFPRGKHVLMKDEVFGKLWDEREVYELHGIVFK